MAVSCKGWRIRRSNPGDGKRYSSPNPPDSPFYSMGICRDAGGEVGCGALAPSWDLEIYFFSSWHNSCQWARASSLLLWLHDHTQTLHTRYDSCARRRELYMTTHNIQKRQTSMPSVGFEPATLASERPQTHALYRAATGIGFTNNKILMYISYSLSVIID